MTDQPLKKGDAIQARQIMMYGSPASWVGGYTFRHYETDEPGTAETRPKILHGKPATCIVEVAAGQLKGAPVRYDVACVRKG